MSPNPISLSDVALSQIMALCRPLTPSGRTAFLAELASELQALDQEPVGDGTVHRIAAQLLRSGMFEKGITADD